MPGIRVMNDDRIRLGGQNPKPPLTGELLRQRLHGHRPGLMQSKEPDQLIELAVGRPQQNHAIRPLNIKPTNGKLLTMPQRKRTLDHEIDTCTTPQPGQRRDTLIPDLRESFLTTSQDNAAGKARLQVIADTSQKPVLEPPAAYGERGAQQDIRRHMPASRQYDRIPIGTQNPQNSRRPLGILIGNSIHTPHSTGHAGVHPGYMATLTNVKQHVPTQRYDDRETLKTSQKGGQRMLTQSNVKNHPTQQGVAGSNPAGPTGKPGILTIPGFFIIIRTPLFSPSDTTRHDEPATRLKSSHSWVVSGVFPGSPVATFHNFYIYKWSRSPVEGGVALSLSTCPVAQQRHDVAQGDISVRVGGEAFLVDSCTYDRGGQPYAGFRTFAAHLLRRALHPTWQDNQAAGRQHVPSGNEQCQR